MSSSLARGPGARGEPAGFKGLREFIAQVDAGAVPGTATTTHLAAAFRKILDGTDANLALQLTRRRGRMRETWSERNNKPGNKDEQIAAFMRDSLTPHASIDDDLRLQIKRGALTRTIEAAARRFCKSEREIERVWSLWKHPFQLGVRIQFIRAHLSDRELDALENVDAHELMHFARARRSDPSLSLRQLLQLHKADNKTG